MSDVATLVADYIAVLLDEGPAAAVQPLSAAPPDIVSPAPPRAAEARVTTEPLASDAKTLELQGLQVDGLGIAIPAVLVSALLPLPPLQALHDAPPWALGQCATPLGQRVVADLARLLGLPGRALPRTLLLLADCPWALAIESVGPRLQVGAASVRWRDAAQRAARRPWLAGMLDADGAAPRAVLDQSSLCALLREGHPHDTRAHARGQNRRA